MAGFSQYGNSGFMYEAAGVSQQPLGGFHGTYPPKVNLQHNSGARRQQQQQQQQKKQPANLYCEICGISCSSEQAVKEHLAGQKHRKKVAVRSFMVPGQPTVNIGHAVATVVPVVASNLPTVGKANKAGQQTAVLFCDLCNVSCCGAQVFAGHVQGLKHQKALKLQSRAANAPIPAPKAPEIKVNLSNAEGLAEDTDSSFPVLGVEHMSTLTNEAGNVVGFYCNLCNCSLGDPRGRIAHLKGQRHRLNYKKKVDNSVQIAIKPNSRSARKQEFQNMKRYDREDHWQKMDAIAARFDVGFHSPGMFQFSPAALPWGHLERKLNGGNVDDRYVYTKRDEARIAKKEVDNIFEMAETCETALKSVSDIIAHEDNILLPQSVNDTKVKQETDKAEDNILLPQSVDDTTVKQETDKAETTVNVVPPEAQSATAKPDAAQPVVPERVSEPEEKLVRVVRGVMRVGRLATGMFLTGDNEFQLVVLSKDKPTWPLLERIAAQLTNQLAVVAPSVDFNVQTYDDGTIRVVREAEPRLTATISVTSPTVRQLQNEDDELADAETTPDPENMLPRETCLEALAQLRRTKWYQVRCSRLPHYDAVLRVLRDLCKRNTCWLILNDWAQELLVEKCICYAGFDQGPGMILRTVFECIASGLLTTDGIGLYDPCEKNPVDAVGDLTGQQREDITASAQTATRLLAFHQMYKVLGVKQYVRPPRPWLKNKRVAPDNSAEGQAQEKRPKEDSNVDNSNGTVENTEGKLEESVESVSNNDVVTC